VQHAKTVQAPTLPFTDEEMEKILAGVENYPNHPLGRRKQLRAFILLLRYSGLRIGDAVSIERDRLTGGAVFLFTAKTGTPVRCPLPQVAQEAINDLGEIDGNGQFPFFSGNGQLKTAVANWQRTIEKLGRIAGVLNFHAHRFRDTAAVSWLNHGISIEDVSILLGHSDIRVTQRHYNPWIKIRQDRLEEAVRRTFTA
jgi:integrase